MLKTLTAPLMELAGFDEAKRVVKEGKETLGVYGCTDSQKLHMLWGLSEDYAARLIVTADEGAAREIAEDFRLYDRNVMLYPAKDTIFYQADIHGNELAAKRLQCIKRRMEGRRTTVVTTIDALLTPLLTPETFKEYVLALSVHDTISEEALAKRLVVMGYERNYQVEAPGQFSIRGGIVDVFDLTEENPFRIELWGDEIESLRSFDLFSQRSVEELSRLRLYPATEVPLSKARLQSGLSRIGKEEKEREKELRDGFHTEEAHRLSVTFAELSEEAGTLGALANPDAYIRYFYEETVSLSAFFAAEDACVILDEPSRIKERADEVEREFTESMEKRLDGGYILPGQTALLESVSDTAKRLEKLRVFTVSALDMRAPLLKADRKLEAGAQSQNSYNNSFEALMGDLERYKRTGYRTLLFSASVTRAKRLARDVGERGLTAFYSENMDRTLQKGEVMVCYGAVRRGFSYPMLKFAVISESDIFGQPKRKKRKFKKYEGATALQDFNELKAGDYVVHESHGLGIYRGIEKIEIDKVAKDFMKIEYRDGGNLYVLASNFRVVQKYAAAGAKKPKLNKLGSREWDRTKQKTKSAVNEVARDLVELYAARQKKRGFAFHEDTVWQREFEELFPFEETDDQLAAIADTKADMESEKIMDRLICGDVGFGKTEVALRAAFKAVQDNKQAVFLVPTTILAEQHYNTFLQRLKDFPVRVDMLSRFRTSAEQKKTIADLKKGQVDIVIGTHRLLSKDVTFKDLGLLIIDEEQRFGVTHKEKLKKLKENVDVLSLSATPIPRTLHMSLSGIRDMSLLTEAPSERMPIQTFVCEYNEEMVREAIARELARGGQVYYVYNRVSHIESVAEELRRLLPEANIAYAHGQMKENELERIMYDFVDGSIDVLVSTTIIETGMDIPNVNTMIVHDSDKMGLSQLYQLRGRVGRSNRTAYAFLMYKRDTLLKEVAEKRLQAIREFTELGSGFKVAMRDLEIRGAGNLLGRLQHGHMEAVGYDLYCKLLNEAVRAMKGETVTEDFATSVDLDADAYIPPEYILNETQKLDIYKRIAGIETNAECEDMKAELCDRFGALPRSVENLLRISLIRERAHRLYVNDVKGGGGEIRFMMQTDAKINVAGIPRLLSLCGRDFSFQGKGTPFFRYRYRERDRVEKEDEKVLSLTENLLKKMEECLLDETD